MPLTKYSDIDSKHLVGYIQPYRNKEKIAVFIFRKHSEMERVLEIGCAACFVGFSEYEDNVIGGIFFSKKELKLEYIIHEISHATFHYMKVVKPKFNLGKAYSHLNKKDEYEERFCNAVGIISGGIGEILNKHGYI